MTFHRNETLLAARSAIRRSIKSTRAPQNFGPRTASCRRPALEIKFFEK